MKNTVSLIVAMALALPAGAQHLNLKSPDGRNTIEFAKDGRQLTYSVAVDGEQVVLPSRAGLDLDNWVWEMALGKRDLEQPQCWMDMLTVDSVSYADPVRSAWTPLLSLIHI